MMYLKDSKRMFDTPKHGKMLGREVIITGTVESIDGDKGYRYTYSGTDWNVDNFWLGDTKWFTDITDMTLTEYKELLTARLQKQNDILTNELPERDRKQYIRELQR